MIVSSTVALSDPEGIVHGSSLSSLGEEGVLGVEGVVEASPQLPS